MPTTTIQAMMLTRKGRFVRISLNDSAHSIVRMTPDKVRSLDIRVGDTVEYTPRKLDQDDRTAWVDHVLLEFRPPDAVKFSA